jgi:hypothetical protein
MAFVGLWGYSNLLYHHMRVLPRELSVIRSVLQLASQSHRVYRFWWLDISIHTLPITQLPQSNWTIEEELGTNSTEFQHVLLFAVPPIKTRPVTCTQPSRVDSCFSDSIVQLIMFPEI